MPSNVGQGGAPSRVAAVDGLRGVLALVVLAWHVCAPFGLAWMLVLANAAVGLFFVLSGYVLARAWDGRFGVFLVRRFLRLWPVYALCLGAGYLIAGAPPVWSQFFWYPLITANDRPAIDPPAWSLCLEVWAMPFMPLILWAAASTIVRAALAMLALMAASWVVPQIGVGALFVAGAYLSRTEFRFPPLATAGPQWLGRVSYSLYLSHTLVLVLAVRMFGPWGGVAAIPAAFAVAWLLCLAVERPSVRLSRKAGAWFARSRGFSTAGEGVARG